AHSFVTFDRPGDQRFGRQRVSGSAAGISGSTAKGGRRFGRQGITASAAGGSARGPGWARS
ncbi:MAG TPA: hypothetical protein VIX82_17480, partial [Solirubrobacteraceae bacterium]